MTLHVLVKETAERKGKKRKLTCLTCQLKGCVGKCRFEPAECPQPPRAA